MKAESIEELEAKIRFSKLSRAGVLGGVARAEKLGPERCKEESRRIANLRWGNKTPEQRSLERAKGRDPNTPAAFTLRWAGKTPEQRKIEYAKGRELTAK